MKNKQDILKLHPMIGILTPLQWDEIHKAMDAYLNEYKAEQLTLTDVVGHSEQLRFLIDKFQTPKGNYLIELLMAEKERKDKKP